MTDTIAALRAEAKANLDLAERHMNEKHRLRAELAALRAENERLRAALREIAADSFSVYAIEVARAALDLPSGKAQ